jgi:hypothetical protein
MKHNHESRAELELFRVRPSQPSGRRGGTVFGQSDLFEFDEVKGVCPESDPEPRERVKVPDVYPLPKGADNMGQCTRDECWSQSGGVTDSIESDRGYAATRRGARRLLRDEHLGYRQATLAGSGREGQPLGMETGLVMKWGNAHGVKVSTYDRPWKEKHRRYTEERQSYGN